MKKSVVIILSILILSSCAVTRDRQVSMRFLDYRPYTEAGFFISPDPYPGMFTSLGEFSITVKPAILSSSKDAGRGRQQKDFEDGVYAKQTYGIVHMEEIPSEELLEMAVQKAKSVGANGIANFKCLTVYDTHATRNSVSSVLSHYEISGLCISIE